MLVLEENDLKFTNIRISQYVPRHKRCMSSLKFEIHFSTMIFNYECKRGLFVGPDSKSDSVQRITQIRVHCQFDLTRQVDVHTNASDAHMQIWQPVSNKKVKSVCVGERHGYILA